MKRSLYLNAYYKDNKGNWRYDFDDSIVPDSYDVETIDLSEGGMGAPELLVSTMLDQAKLAELLGVKLTTVHSKKSRGELPLPQFDNGKTALWAVPVIRFWMQVQAADVLDSLGRRKRK